MLVIDASIVLALLTGHPARHKIADALRQDSDAVAPAHLDAEVLSALRGRRRRRVPGVTHQGSRRLRLLGGRLSPAELRAGVSTLAAMPVRRVPLDDATLLGDALKWFHNLSAYDAIYLALASLTGGVLVTGDAALAGAARRAKTPHRHIDCSA